MTAFSLGGPLVARSVIVMLGCLVSTFPIAPVEAANVSLAGKFAFRTDVDPGKTTCARLTAATAARLTAAPYKCERTPLSSGKAALLCSPPGGRGSYLVFDTKAACESERKDEEAAE